MDKEKILATARTYWDDEDQYFVTESPLADYVVGAGLTVDEAKAAFVTMVTGQYEAYLAGRHGVLNARKVGRPRAGRVNLTTRLAPDIKTTLNQLAKLHKKSQGEIIEILIKKVQYNEVTL